MSLRFAGASFLISALIVIPSASPLAAVQAAKQSNAANSGQCPNLERLIPLCSMVFARAREPGTRYRFTYQRLMHEAACATDEPNESPRNLERIQSLWRDHQNAFRCRSSDFDVVEGNVLKYAISTENYSFITTAVSRWNLDLNMIDPADGRTVLDYAVRERDSTQIPEVRRALQQQIDVLREHGALYASEVRQRNQR